MQASSRSIIQVAALLAAALSITGAAGAAAYEKPKTDLLGHTIQDAIGYFDSEATQDRLPFHDPTLFDDFAGATGISLVFSGATIDGIERDHRAVHETASGAAGAATHGIVSAPVPAPGVLPLLGIAALLVRRGRRRAGRSLSGRRPRQLERACSGR